MKTVLITGVSSGIGQALAKKFLAENFAVIGTSLTGKVDFDDKNLTIYQLDLTSTDSMNEFHKHVFKKCEADKTPIDILINNAGVMFDDDETHVYVETLRKTLEVNLLGAVGTTEFLIPCMSTNGHVIFISSAAGSLADTGSIEKSRKPYHYPAYKISKCALNMYMRTLALRFKHEGPINNKNGDYITASCINPGWVKTAIGGDDADLTPEQAAENIYKLAITRPETGQFWWNGEKYPW